MPLDNYQAKRTTTLRNREDDLLKLLSSKSTDDKKLFKAGDLVKQAHLRLLRAKLEDAELRCPSEMVVKTKSKGGIHKRANIKKQIINLKTEIEFWENMSVEKVIDKYRESDE